MMDLKQRVLGYGNWKERAYVRYFFLKNNYEDIFKTSTTPDCLRLA